VIYLVFGRRELGKTTLAYAMIQGIAKRTIIDPRRMIQRRDARIEYVSTMADADDAISDMVDNPSLSEVVYQPREDDLDQAFIGWTRSIKRTLLDERDRQIGILVDEASFYNLNTPTFQWLIKCVPRDQAYIVITAHQPKDVPTTIRAIADHWFVFYTSQQTDLERIAEKSPEAADAARHLRDRAFVHWDDTKARLDINARPSSWFIPLSEHHHA
jgi:hypothetical protein